MVSALVLRSSGPGSSPGRGHCVVFLGKTLNSHSASLHLGVQMSTAEFYAGGNLAMDKHSIHRGWGKAEIFLYLLYFTSPTLTFSWLRA